MEVFVVNTIFIKASVNQVRVVFHNERETPFCYALVLLACKLTTTTSAKAKTFIMHVCVLFFFLDQCYPTLCLNGGFCSLPNTCHCGGTGYTGQYCEIRRLWMLEVALLITAP